MPARFFLDRSFWSGRERRAGLAGRGCRARTAATGREARIFSRLSLTSKELFVRILSVEYASTEFFGLRAVALCTPPAQCRKADAGTGRLLLFGDKSWY
jgi:hypothetical protein